MLANVMMRISTKGRYALRIMLDLAAHDHSGPVSLRAVAERQQITLKYMETIMSLLLRENLVSSSRGKSGGYKLTRPPRDYNVYEILRTAEGDLMPVQCLAQPVNNCPLQNHCSTLPLWEGLGKAIRDYLENITLEQILNKGAELSFCDGI